MWEALEKTVGHSWVFTELGAAYLSLLVSAVSITIATSISRHESRSAVRPVIVFEYDPREGWQATNIGGGPALNVIVAQANKKNWLKPVRIPPLSVNGKRALTWCLHDNTHSFGALYEDVDGRKYTTVCGNDLSRVKRGHAFGPWKETDIRRHWAEGEKTNSI